MKFKEYMSISKDIIIEIGYLITEITYPIRNMKFRDPRRSILKHIISGIGLTILTIISIGILSAIVMMIYHIYDVLIIIIIAALLVLAFIWAKPQ